MMHGHEKSDPAIVANEPTNKAGPHSHRSRFAPPPRLASSEQVAGMDRNRRLFSSEPAFCAGGAE
jgi:hypothetical protein